MNAKRTYPAVRIRKEPLNNIGVWSWFIEDEITGQVLHRGGTAASRERAEETAKEALYVIAATLRGYGIGG